MCKEKNEKVTTESKGNRKKDWIKSGDKNIIQVKIKNKYAMKTQWTAWIIFSTCLNLFSLLSHILLM